jgi:pyruvate,water dikinase
LNKNNESGTIEINADNSKDCCLNESECLSLANISLEVHKYYGNPRDIEWGIKDKQIYLFQSRPITNLDNSWTEWEIMHDLDSGQQSEREYLSRANTGEVFPGASSYICLSWLINTWNANGFVSH